MERFEWGDHIVFNPQILVGKATIRGTRISATPQTAAFSRPMASNASQLNKPTRTLVNTCICK